MNKSDTKAYVKEFMLSMAVYMIVLITSSILVNISPATAWWRIPLAVSPVAPAIFAMITFMRFVSRMDELQRRIQFEAVAFGFGSAGMLTFSYGFLENIGFPHLSWLYIFPLMMVLWGIGVLLTSWRYR